MNIWTYFQALDKIIKRLVYAVVGITVYALLGFFLLPYILQPLLIDKASSELGREVSLQSLEINPFALSVRLKGLSVSGKHAKQLLGFEQLYVNFQAISLFKKVIAFDEISLVRPEVKIMLLSSGEYNFQDLLNNLKNENKTDKSDEENNEAWPFAVDKFRYVEGAVYFSDENRVTPFYSQLEDISISLDDFSTRPGDGNLHHIKAESLRGTKVDWKGEFSLSPLKSSGQIDLYADLTVASDYMHDQMLVKIEQGKLSLKTNYDFMFSDEGAKLNFSEMLASVEGLVVLRKENDEKVLTWELFSVDLNELDLINKKLVVNKVSMQGANVTVEKDEQKTVDFGDLFVLQNSINDQPAEIDSSEASWDIKIAHIINTDAFFELHDNSVKPSVKQVIQFKLVTLDNLQPFSDELALLESNLIVNDHGLVNIAGKIKPVSRLLDLDITASSVKLTDFQSYLNDIARIKILDGIFETNVKINIDASSEPASVKVQGDVDVLSLKLRDTKLKEKFLSWKKLAVKNIQFQHPDQQLDIKSIDIDKPYLRLIMDKGGETNIQKLLIVEEPEVTEKNKKQNKSDGSGFVAAINKVNVRDGKMDFADNSLSPSFNAGIYGLKGGISGLSSKQLSKAKVDLKGKVDKYAPVIIKGDINPLTQDKFTEIEMLFKGIELTTFTPYSGKFAGYKVEKGKLTLELDYKLSKNELVAENRVILDQLTLGEKTDSEDATGLPVNFALSLLKDSKGVIDFNLPIRGNTDDPDFHYGGLVWGALGNLIVGIVSSPFSALANLVGGDSEGLDFVVFSANSAELSVTEKTKLDSLANALIQRPELHLEIRGVSSTLVDHDEIAYVKVLKKLKLKPSALSTELDDSSKDDIVDYYESLTNKSADEFTPENQQLTSKQKDDYIFNKALIVVLEKTEVTQAEYHLLAKSRADKIQSYLIDMGKVPVSNLFLLDSSTQLENEFEDVEAGLLKLPLSLKAK